MPNSVVSFSYRSGKSFARGTDIDPLLLPEETEKLYSLWRSSWPEPLEFSGGVKSITCEMILDIPELELFSTYKKPFAKRLLDVAKQNAG